MWFSQKGAAQTVSCVLLCTCDRWAGPAPRFQLRAGLAEAPSCRAVSCLGTTDIGPDTSLLWRAVSCVLECLPAPHVSPVAPPQLWQPDTSLDISVSWGAKCPS